MFGQINVESCSVDAGHLRNFYFYESAIREANYGRHESLSFFLQESSITWTVQVSRRAREAPRDRLNLFDSCTKAKQLAFSSGQVKNHQML